MNMIRSIHSRRDFFKFATASFATIVSALNAGCDAFEKQNLSIEQRLIQSLNHLQRAREIGKAYRAQNETIKSYSQEQLTTELLLWLNIDSAKVKKLSDKKLIQLLNQKIREDFTNENIIIIGQWMFSKTEAMLCALADAHDQHSDKEVSQG